MRTRRSVGVRRTAAVTIPVLLVGLGLATEGVAASPTSDPTAGVTTRVSEGPGGVQADGPSGGAAISADGRFVAFHSSASNLVAGDTNGEGDVFVRNRATGVTRRVSVGPAAPRPTASATWRRSPRTAATWPSGRPPRTWWPGTPTAARRVRAGPVDWCDPAGVGRTGRHAGQQQQLPAGDLRERPPHRLRVSRLEPGGRGHQRLGDVFVRNQATGVTRRVSVGPGGAQANDASIEATISADGRQVAFASFAGNLVAGDTNDRRDVFVRDRASRRDPAGVGRAGRSPKATTTVSTRSISAHGRDVAFESAAENLVAGRHQRSPRTCSSGIGRSR